ncbi:helix-turn-helix domain-containing protein [Nocardioides sp. CFH 31398]|uniref:helix-turn-helix domain-containing protein n=1 Tax=Nocardioides sp. CFH 31398 TaxID=2919579 RepID=UPI001F061B89|nr:helix-turn-helix domain-containing protein [Nocardioides sp. CFH 31398]MCH1867073.1 helix-turn-helix domain-containing protein [Nocardioides sp. CFH 31398]
MSGTQAVTLVEPQQYVSVDDAAAILSCNPKTVRRAIARNELRAHRVGSSRLIRIARADVEALLRPAVKAAGLDDYVRQIVDQAPQLTSEQRDRLTSLLRPAGGGDRVAS